MSDDKITYLNNTTKLDIPVVRVAEGLLEDAERLDCVLVLSFNKDGYLETRSSSGDVGTMLEMMELFKYNLLQGRYDDGAN